MPDNTRQNGTRTHVTPGQADPDKQKCSARPRGCESDV